MLSVILLLIWQERTQHCCNSKRPARTRCKRDHREIKRSFVNRVSTSLYVCTTTVFFLVLSRWKWYGMVYHSSPYSTVLWGMLVLRCTYYFVCFPPLLIDAFCSLFFLPPWAWFQKNKLLTILWWNHPHQSSLWALGGASESIPEKRVRAPPPALPTTRQW